MEFREKFGVATAISKKTFPRLVRNIFDEFEKKTSLMTKSFALTGLFPFDSRAPDYSRLLSEQRKLELWIGKK